MAWIQRLWVKPGVGPWVCGWLICEAHVHKLGGYSIQNCLIGEEIPDRLATEFMLTAMSLVAGLISAVSESPSGTVISEKGITSRHVDHGVASKSLAFFFYTLLI